MLENIKDANDLITKLNNMTIRDMRIFAREFGVVPRNRRRDELISLILATYNGEKDKEQRVKKGRPPKETIARQTLVSVVDADTLKSIGSDKGTEVDDSYPTEGILEIMPDGYGFVRTRNYSTTNGKDYYISAQAIQHMCLKAGDKLKVSLRQFKDRKAPTVVYVLEVNDIPATDAFKRTPFDTLEPCYPNKRIKLENEKNDYSLRALDLVAPVGKGQRGLIVAPPKTGKTMLLKKIALSVTKNNPEIHLIVLLIDERPEEVTDFKESVKCEVVYSTFDQQPQNHIRIAELVFANAKRRVEQGQDVMILLDSITRLGRAYNQCAEQTGRTLTGGLDIAALQEPKKLFGAGRNTKGGGSLTILATALIDTGSKMDDIIYEEFKGTGNMEIQLDRRMSERRIFPAIDLNRSSTRHEELLLTQDEMEGMYLARKILGKEDVVSATENLLEVIMTTDNNTETIETLKRLMVSAAKRKAMKAIKTE